MEEEAGRQINHPFSIAFQELGPRGGWRHGSIFWIVAQTQCIVCRVKLVCNSPPSPTNPHLPPLPPAPSLQKGEITSRFPGALGTGCSTAHSTSKAVLGDVVRRDAVKTA